MGFLTVIVIRTAVSQTADVKQVHRSNTFLPLGQADCMSIPSTCPFAISNDTFHTMGSLFVYLSGRVIVTHSQRTYPENTTYPHVQFFPPRYSLPSIFCFYFYRSASNTGQNLHAERYVSCLFSWSQLLGILTSSRQQVGL